MFLKLFKRAFKRPMKTVILLSAISLGIGLVAGLMSLVAKNINNPYVQTLSITTIMLCTFGISALSIVSSVLLYNFFRRDVATDEAYLTFTLPATPAEQLGSRFLAILLWSVIISAVSVISYGILIAFGLPMAETNPGTPSGGFDPNAYMLVVEGILLWLATSLALPVHVIFAIIFNNALSVKMHSKASVIFVILMAYGELMVLGILFMVLFISSIMADSVIFIHLLLWFFILLISGLSVFLYFTSLKLIGKKLNLS